MVRKCANCSLPIESDRGRNPRFCLRPDCLGDRNRKNAKDHYLKNKRFAEEMAKKDKSYVDNSNRGRLLISQYIRKNGIREKALKWLFKFQEQYIKRESIHITDRECKELMVILEAFRID